MRWLLAFSAALAYASAQDVIGQTALQGNDVWAALIIEWPPVARIYKSNTLYCEGGGSDRTGTCSSNTPAMNDEDLTLDILSYLQAEIYNVGCGTVATYANTIDTKPAWTWSVATGKSYFLGDRPGNDMYTTHISTTSPGSYARNRYSGGVPEGADTNGQPVGMVTAGAYTISPSTGTNSIKLFLPYQVYAGTDNTQKNYVRQRTLCMSVNDVSRIKTWGASKYGWTDVRFTCHPQDEGFTRQNNRNSADCTCDGDRFMVNGQTKQKMFSNSGMIIVTILLAVSIALIVALIWMYMRRNSPAPFTAQDQMLQMQQQQMLQMQQGLKIDHFHRWADGPHRRGAAVPPPQSSPVAADEEEVDGEANVGTNFKLKM